MKSIIIAILAFLYSELVIGQQLFEDGSGESSLFVSSVPFAWIRLNTSSSSIALGANRFRRSGYDFPSINSSLLYGGDLKLKAKDGLASLIKSSEFVPGITLNGNLGLHSYDWLDDNKSLSSLYIRGSYSYNEFSFADTSDPSNPILSKSKKGYAQVLLNFNVDLKFVNAAKDTTLADLFVGISTGYKQSSNYNDLNEVQVSTVQGTSPSIIVSKVYNARQGDFKEYSGIPLNIDVGITPRIFSQQVIGFNFFYRTQFSANPRITNAGWGIYFTKAKEVQNVIGGLAWQFNDIRNKLNSDKSTIDRSIAFFYIGYTLGNL